MGISELLRADLLAGSSVALAGGVRPSVADALGELGARLIALDGGERAGEIDPAAWAAKHGPVDALVYDAVASFADGGADGLRAAVDDAWSAIHTVATAAFIPAEREARIVLLAPRVIDGAHAAAVRAALENTARTLSVEWARFGITTTAITPGAGTGDADVAALVAFLSSPAGRYYSGCRFELGAV